MAGFYWPEGLPTSETVETFEQLFLSFGFERCEDGSLESGHEKVALYVELDGSTASHASWQTIDGRWASKIGTNGTDVLHDAADDMNSEAYGRVDRYYRRARRRWEMPVDPTLTGVGLGSTAPLGTVTVP